MTPRQAIETIRKCVASDQYEIKRHVFERMVERGMMLPDLLALIEDPDEAEAAGIDDYGRERWKLSGRLHDGLRAAVVVAIDATPHATFFTIYWD